MWCWKKLKFSWTDRVINEEVFHRVKEDRRHLHEKCEEREKTNKMQQSDAYYQLLSEHVSGIIMLIFRRTKTVCYCIRCTALVLLDVVGSVCGALRCRMRAL